jgi:predicted ATPase/DNA-binding winged helix-turn-helix (wHTH) protein
MPAASRFKQYRWDRAVLIPGQRKLLVDGIVAPITARAFDLLTLLAERAGQLVMKDEIFERVWAGVIVEESNLAVQISALRKILGSAAIENIPGRGYRFLSKVEASDADELSHEARSHLPRPLTSFVGHGDHIAQCARLLHSSRLLTVTGIGGLGKTRLSVEMANACGQDYADGVWFVDLAPITDPRLVSQAVALVVGVADQAAERMLEAIQKFIRNRRALLILDNCEHLLRGCAEFVGVLLHACAQLTVLATSREPLHLQGEAIFPLPALSFPNAGLDLKVEDVAKYEAVRLFVERATAVSPNFELTEGNQRAVREICMRVDGIPLALELAAARVRVLSVEAIAERLNDRFRLLKNNDTTAPSRQQTLRATIDWSYDLLSPPEQALLGRLAVFAGGWTFAAAEAVGAGNDTDADDVLDLYSRLVDKSLVAVEHNGARYRMLETVREYASARLEASGEAQDARACHLKYYLSLAEEAAPNFVGPHENAWHYRCDLERQNLVAAYRFGLRDHTDAQPALRLVYGVRRWICRGAFDVGRPVLAELLARPGAQARDVYRCRALVGAAFLSYYKGAYDDAICYGEEGFSIARELDIPALAADARNHMALGYLGKGDRASVGTHFDDAASLARLGGDKDVLTDALNSMAELCAIDGDLDKAERVYGEVLELATNAGAANQKIVSLLNLARIAISRGASLRAATLLRDAIEIGGEVGTARNAQNFLGFGAGLAALVADGPSAARFYGASNSRFADVSQHREPADEGALMPCIAKARAAIGPAVFARHEAVGFAMRTEEATMEFQQWLADLIARLQPPPSTEK